MQRRRTARQVIGVAIGREGSLEGVEGFGEGFSSSATDISVCKGQIIAFSNAFMIFLTVKFSCHASLNNGQKILLVIDIHPSPPWVYVSSLFVYAVAKGLNKPRSSGCRR